MPRKICIFSNISYPSIHDLLKAQNPIYRILKAGLGNRQICGKEQGEITTSQRSSVPTHHHKHKGDGHEKCRYGYHTLACCYGQCHRTGRISHHHKGEHHDEEGLHNWFQALVGKERGVESTCQSNYVFGIASYAKHYNIWRN